MISFGKGLNFLAFSQFVFSQEYKIEFREIYGPVIVDDLPFDPVTIELNQGRVNGRKVTLFEKEIEVYRGLLKTPCLTGFRCRRKNSKNLCA